MNSHRAVFLDRDGVLIESFVRDGVPHPPDAVDQVRMLPGVREALSQLRDAGFLLIVVTNQPDVARGTQTIERVNAINDFLSRQLPLDAIYVCPHDTPERCGCRKPAAGMLTQAATEHGVNLGKSYLVGDRWSDIAAGATVGCVTFLIDLPYSQGHRCLPSHRVADLSDAARCILASSTVAEE